MPYGIGSHSCILTCERTNRRDHGAAPPRSRSSLTGGSPGAFGGRIFFGMSSFPPYRSRQCLTELPKLTSVRRSSPGTLRLLGDDESDTLLPLVRRLPVACDRGWLAMGDAVFGSGWPGRLGDLVPTLADELPDRTAARLLGTALLPPDDPRWGASMEKRGELLARAGVVDGLRLLHVPDVDFHMQGAGFHELPPTAPSGVPQSEWDAWRRDVRGEARPHYEGVFEYKLSAVRVLPEIHHLTGLSYQARSAFSRLVLASFEQWPAGWESAVIHKVAGHSWSRRITSPVKYWLKTLSWCRDRADVEQPLRSRWIVPESYLRGQRERYSHLDPLSLDLARKLNDHPERRETLVRLGLNAYPTEEDRTGPALLDALAAAWTADRIPPARFDVFLGQVRDAWRHLAPDRGLPERFLVRAGRHTFSMRAADELADVYLPDEEDRTRSLREHGKQTLEMLPADARRTAHALSVNTNIKRASMLDERFLINGASWTGLGVRVPILEESVYATWLPVTVLTVAAYGGANPTGTATARWNRGRARLRGAHVLECEEIAVELVDGDRLVASSEPAAQWLPGEVLAIRRDRRLAYGFLSSAAQAILERQDLLKDLRLVLDTLASLAGSGRPTSEQVEAALERAEIDAQAISNVRNHWAGANSAVADRIRPVLVLLELPWEDLDTAATDIDRLTEWLSSHLRQWPVGDLLTAARRSRDDRAMGEAAWRALGGVAQLPSWNEALSVLGDRYVTVENRDVDEQTAEHLEAAAPLLRSFARYVAVDTGKAVLFREVEAVRQSFKIDDDWSTRWWEVPFDAVIDALCSRYGQIAGVEHHVAVLEGAGTLDELRIALEQRGIERDPDPYETARWNVSSLEETLRGVHDLHRAWVELRSSGAVAPETSEPAKPPSDVDPVAYLHTWSDGELLDRALRVVDDGEFMMACAGCGSLDDVRTRLGLNLHEIEVHRGRRLRLEQEAARRRRTFVVAGASFEVGGAGSYRELLSRLEGLPEPVGPRASKDRFTALAEARSSSGGIGGGGGKTSHVRPSADLRELAWIIPDDLRFELEGLGGGRNGEVVDGMGLLTEARWFVRLHARGAASSGKGNDGVVEGRATTAPPVGRAVSTGGGAGSAGRTYPARAPRASAMRRHASR